MTYTRQPNPVWLFDDLVGNILDDNYYAHFLTNEIPYLPQDVFQTPQGTPWANPLQFLPNGTLPNNLYFQEGVVYRIEIRRGPTQFDPLIYLIQNYVPGGGGEPFPVVSLPIDNQITNPQFAAVLFDSPLTITNNGNNDYEIAPGWTLELASGVSSVLQLDVIAVPGTDVIPTTDPNNPSYVLRLTHISGTFTSIKLRQRFSETPAIWAQEGISISLTGKMQTGSDNISVSYRPSTGTEQTILSDAFSSSYKEFTGGITLPVSDNPDSGDDAYVDIVITLPVDNVCFLTNIQTIGSPEPAPFPYVQTTVERQIDQTFHYYKPQLAFKPIPSFLVGWDFPLNPSQFGSTVGPVATGSNKSFYAWDQTIVFQSTTNGIVVNRGTAGQIVLNASATTQAAIIQYLDGNELYHLLRSRLSVNIAAIAQNIDLTATVSLWYTKDVSLPSTVGSANSLVATLDANGKPATFNGTWIEIPRLLGQNATFTIGNIGSANEFNEYNFSGWRADDLDDFLDATFFAIVIGTSSITIGNLVAFESVGLCLGDIATRPAPQQLSQVLEECQYYYEKSYNVSVKEGTVSSPGQFGISIPLFESGPNQGYYLKTFSIVFNTKKRVSPVMRFYSPNSTTVSRMLIEIFLPGTGSVVNALINPTGTYVATLGLSGITMLADSAAQQLVTATNSAHEGLLFTQYVADSRLGL